jgi:hypothetical protein
MPGARLEWKIWWSEEEQEGEEKCGVAHVIVHMMNWSRDSLIDYENEDEDKEDDEEEEEEQEI